MPTHELAIKKALKRLGATNSDECSIKLEDKETDNLWFERVQDITVTENLYAANNVLRAVEREEKNNELDKLEAVIDFADRYDSASIIKLEDNIDSFRYFDNVYDKEELGRALIDENDDYYIDEDIEEFLCLNSMPNLS